LNSSIAIAAQPTGIVKIALALVFSLVEIVVSSKQLLKLSHKD
jgi:hypothetical protein